MRSDSSKKAHLGFYLQLRRLFNLRADMDVQGTIDLVKSNVEFRSANAWTLVFAIFIASVGLNVNSTAVIIGAMLISPLMGPIIGVGFALGTYDFELLNKSARNLAAAVVISLVASTAYFLLSPLSDIQSELLARTRPSFYDVLIAFFGGAAGIIALSRKERGNAIPGVAIATALMPPLCTAGFGLATKNFSYFFGAMYLFVINSVFISISTFLFVRYLRFYKVKELPDDEQKRINRWITSVGLVVLIPSFFMAWYLQRESGFNHQANKYINQQFQSDHSLIVDREVQFSLKNPRLKVSLLGDRLSESELEDLKNKASDYNLDPAIVTIAQSTFSENLAKSIGEKISAAENNASQLQIKLRKNEEELASIRSLHLLAADVSDEVAPLLPKIAKIVLNKEIGKVDGEPEQISAFVHWKATPSKSDIRKATEYLSKRFKLEAEQIGHLRTL